MNKELLNHKLIDRQYMTEVIELLQSISIFKPDSSRLNFIWENYSAQQNNFSYVFFNSSNTLVGYGSFVTEVKIRGGKMAHFEDIVISSDYRGQGLGKEMIKILIKEARNMGCYKIGLCCSEENVKFYETCGLNVNGISMSLIL